MILHPVDARILDRCMTASPCWCAAYDPLINDHATSGHTDCEARCGRCDQCTSAAILWAQVWSKR